MSDRIIEKLRGIALKSARPESGRYRIAAAVLDKQGRVLSIGTNSYVKTHPRQAEYAKKVGAYDKSWLHAEVSALVKVKSGVPYKIVVVRVGNDGELRLAKPCKVCEMAIKQAGIKVIEYTM
jgi:deoxycytidylate deaminase